MVQSVDRTLDILEALARAEGDVSLSQLHEQLDLPLGTVHRLLNTLSERGYVVQDKGTRRYGPGPKLLEIAARAAGNSRFNLRQVAQPGLQRLTACTGETSNLVVPQGNEIVYIDQVVSPRLVRMFTEVGRRLPFYCTGAGKAILAGFSKQQAEAYLHNMHLEATTPHTITSSDELRAAIEAARVHGFAIDDEEREEGVRCVAAPVFDHTGACVAALSISGPTTRVTREHVRELGPLVRSVADACSAQLGYRAVETTADVAAV
jgi:IclR family acetate operon transcriptional repressor